MRFLFILLLPFSSLFSLQAIYLTLPHDPAHEMAIHWFESPKEEKIPTLSYEVKGEWQEVKASSEAFGSMSLKKVHLKGLSSDTDYKFRVGGMEYLFRTLPEKLSRPVKIALGGDAYERKKLYEKMNEIASSHSPDFAILGGDIAYASPGGLTKRWAFFFKKWGEEMITKEGRMIPLVGVIGNHDVSHKNPVFFQQLFPYLQRGTYGSLDILESVSFFLLDTGHVAPVSGEQASWLEEKLKESTTPYKFAVYHVAAYPSVFSPESRIPRAVRAEWVPFFEQYGILAAFEHHNHAFKKTHPIREGKIDPTGITYIGDGSWGVSPRKTRDAWYLENKKIVNAFSLMTISSDGVSVEMMDSNGEHLDSWAPSL